MVLDTIKSGESFGVILDRHHVEYPKINKIAGAIKDIFDVRRVRAGKPYMILSSKDSLEEAKVFIYKNDKIRATVVDFKDSIIKLVIPSIPSLLFAPLNKSKLLTVLIEDLFTYYV